MKKIVLKSTMEDERSKRRAMKAVAGIGVDSIAVDIKEEKITVVGEVDPVWLTTKLRKMGFRAELLSVGPAKEEKKSDQGPPKNEKKDAEKKKDEKKAVEPAAAPTVVHYLNPDVYVPYSQGYSYTVVPEEYPSTCTIS
uniref:HMA domain-containing protein n=1 Tax=Picea sitchensis TaxID=3332 RepID=A9NQJ0_PICSI|nr:unknown [Picea sitchensis]